MTIIVIIMLSLFACDNAYGHNDPATERISGQETENKTENKAEDVSELDSGEYKEEYLTVKDFSYKKDTDTYKVGDPGVNPFGFVNVDVCFIDSPEDAIARAKNECTVKHNVTTVYYDTSTDMWMVLFSTEMVLGGCQSVYMNSNGVTQLIVYGE